MAKPIDTGWENIAFEVFKELKGEKEFNKIMEEDNKEPPEPGLFSKARVDLNLTGLNMAFGLKAFFTKKRPSHPFGFGAFGKVQIVNDPKFPEHEFFTPGRIFPVRLRHANLTYDDDASSDFRSATLKFADSDDESPFDLTMSTGRSNIFIATQSLWDAIRGARGGNYKEYVLINPYYIYGVIETIRRAPTSFVDQIYYAHIPFNYEAKDGKKRYVKFRMINDEGLAETGLLSKQEQRKVWERERYPEDIRPKDYLKKEYEDRLLKGPIHYKLQLQLHEASPNDSQHIFNSAKHWDEATHPWLDLADVTITSMFPDDVIERTRNNPANKPDSLSMTGPPESIYDFNCIPYYRKYVYARSQTMRLSRAPDEVPSKNECTYVIYIETGDVKDAGTDANITLSMTGSKGRTGNILLDKTFHDDFKRGEASEYKLKAMDVGDLYLIRFHNDKGGILCEDSDWFVNKVTIRQEGRDTPYEFTCYSWVLNDLVVFHGEGILPQKQQPEVVKIERQLQIQKRQTEYRWFPEGKKVVDFPGYIDAVEHSDIPRNSQFSDPSMKSFLNGRKHAKMNLGLASILTLFEHWDDFDDYKKMYTGWVYSDRPKYLDSDAWKEDSVFGMQYLNGTNPMMIERCNKLPGRFPVTQDHVKDLLDRGLTLSEEIKAGHIYMADYSLLEGIRRNGHGTDELRYVTEPLVLLYVNKKGDLMPIAVQLNQTPSDDNPIWTPNDDKLEWLFVKMWVKAADSQIHQMITHLLMTHLIMEGIALAAWRNLPSIHPIFKLLYPHLRSIMAINTLGRKGLISPGGVSDVTLSVGGGGHLDIIRKFYKQFTWDMVDIPEHLKNRGLMDKDKLPNFHYRDDALALWNVIYKFVMEMVKLYYHNGGDVVQDYELQAWVKDIHDNGFTPTEGHQNHRFPESLKSRDELILLLTRVIFTCSCQHAAVNFGQLDSYAYIPNCPASMHLPPPTKKGETTMDRIMKTLPRKVQTGAQIGTVHLLTRFAEDEKFLGDYSDGLFTDAKALGAIFTFQENIKKVSDSIKTRNKSLKWPYIYLLPERVPNSVAI